LAATSKGRKLLSQNKKAPNYLRSFFKKFGKNVWERVANASMFQERNEEQALDITYP
jgi:hypothetical protein